MAGSIDIGLRHVLMIYPFLAVAAGRGAVRVWEMGRLRADHGTGAGAAAARGFGAADASRPQDPAPARTFWPRLSLVVLLLTVVGHAAAIAPHHLSYFNLLAGGAKNGHRVLIDSNYDWGQNDRSLRSYVEKRGLPYRIDPYAFWPVNGPILVNANALRGALNGGPKAYAWLQRFQPVGRVAWTWFEYDVPPGTFAEPREDEEARQQCLARLFRVREAARLFPGPEFRSLLAKGFAGFGAYDIAFEELRQCLREHPGYGPALIVGGELIVRWKLGVLVFHGREYLDGVRTLRPTMGDDEEQLVALAQRGGLAGNLAQFQVQLGTVLESVGDPQSARDAYRLAGRLDPANPEARAALQRIEGVR
jgi:tetratricopeptide (TPR) repeat protein